MDVKQAIVNMLLESGCMVMVDSKNKTITVRDDKKAMWEFSIPKKKGE